MEGCGPPNERLKLTSAPGRDRGALVSSYGRTRVKPRHRVVVVFLEAPLSLVNPPWRSETTEEVGRFDDESFSYPRVAFAEPHDRSPSRGSAVL